MKLVLITIFLLFYQFNLFGQRIEYDKNIPIEKIRIDFLKMYGGTAQDQLVDVEFIPLSVSNDLLIDHIYNLTIIGDYLGFSDGRKNFWIYSKDGKLIKQTKVNSLFTDFGPYSIPSLTKDNNHFILRNDTEEISINVDGVLKYRKQYYYQGDNPEKMQLGNSIFEYKTFDNRKLKRDYALKINGVSKVNYVLEDTINHVVAMGNAMVKVHEDLGYIKFSNNYQLFELNQQGIHKVWDFIFPIEQSIDQNILYNLKNAQKQISYFNNNHNMILGFGKLYAQDDYLIIQIIKAGSYWIAFNHKTKKITNLKSILPDQSIDYIEFIKGYDTHSDGNHLYTILYPLDFRNALQRSELEGHKMNPDLKKFINYENPVIMKFKIK